MEKKQILVIKQDEEKQDAQLEEIVKLLGETVHVDYLSSKDIFKLENPFEDYYKKPEESKKYAAVIMSQELAVYVQAEAKIGLLH